MASYGDLQFTTTSNAHAVRGLAWPCRVSNTGGMFARNYNETSIKDALIQLILTQRGERPMRLDFGTDFTPFCVRSYGRSDLRNLRKFYQDCNRPLRA